MIRLPAKAFVGLEWPLRKAITTGMMDTPQTPMVLPHAVWLIFGLLVVEGLLWLSERYQWFGFN